MSDLTERLERAERCLTRAGWTYTEGAECWKPPVNEAVGQLWQKIFELEHENARLREMLEAKPKPFRIKITDPLGNVHYLCRSERAGWYLTNKSHTPLSFTYDVKDAALFEFELEKAGDDPQAVLAVVKQHARNRTVELMI